MKAAPLWHALKNDGTFTVRLVHTGQHYDENMSGSFFRELGLPDPDFNLAVGSGRHGKQTAAVIERYEALCLDQERPDWTIVIGDVNSTVGCALAAAKIGIRVAHLEAGLRSFDRSMPEEINRLMTDAIADLLWTPSADADLHLRREGVPPEKIDRIGNIMIDSYELQKTAIAAARTSEKLALEKGKYGVITLHRPSNVDNVDTLGPILLELVSISKRLPLVWPVHPRTLAKIKEFGFYDRLSSVITLTEPLGYTPFISLVKDSKVVITDSGGIQEETTYIGIPCLTLRPNTERPATITEGTNRLVTRETLEKSIDEILSGKFVRKGPPEFWDGQTAQRAVASLKRAITGLNKTDESVTAAA